MASPLVTTSTVSDSGYPSEANWSANRAATNFTLIGTGSLVTCNWWIALPPYHRPLRSWIHFDTSAIPDTASVSNATLRLTCSESGGTASAAVVSSTQSSDTSIVNTEFDHIGSTRFSSDFDYATVNTSYDITLNSAGLSAISKTGYTKLGLRGVKDIDDVAPTSQDYRYYYTHAHATTAYRPKLTVEYTEGTCPLQLLRPHIIPAFL
jgi:hypothetical protein